MRLLDRIASLRGAFAHRVRASLTVLGVVIGTASVVLLASLLHGGRSSLVTMNQSAADPDIIRINTDDAPPDQRQKTMRELSRADADTLAHDVTLNGAMVAAEASFDAWAHYLGRRKRVAIVSSGPTTMELYRLKMASGRALDEDDTRMGRRVCIVGHEVYDELLHFAKTDDLRIEVDGVLFAVVGVLAEKPMIGSTTSTYRWDRKVLIPRTTYDTLYAPSHAVTRIYVRPQQGLGAASRAPVRASVKRILLGKHLGVSNFEIAKDQNGGTEELILMVIEILLLGTGFLAVFASGINIMNVMLVTVSERTREIGLRRALGATQRSILVQFLLEATSLSMIGAFVGIICGSALAWITAVLARNAIGQWDFALPMWSIVLGLALALVTGLGFGLLPAWRAARIAPIDALRTD